MLTLLKNIEMFNKRYNKKRGSAMLMVLMTMAIIIVVGTSMLFVTLSSFSNSIADTQQERAYNAALTVSDTLKGSTQLNTIIETYFTKITENGSAEVQFYNDADFEKEAVNYTIVNGVKVYVKLSKSPNSKKNTIDKVLVDVTGVKGSQESTVSFEAKSQPDGNSTTIQDTFGNSFVVSNNMGSEKTDPRQIFKRIEGDVSINCFETEDGERVMKTRIFNPLVLEGVTGSIYANGDLIIGSVDNMIRVQGNVYVDGNLTVRGLALGVNLPALMKKYYNRKYINYYTYSKKFAGSIEIPWTEPTVVQRQGISKEEKYNPVIGEAMYEKLSDGSYRPIQVYDKISHYTLMDMANDANEYTFWTKNWENGGAAEQVTITFRAKDKNKNWHNIDAEYNQGGINNAQYLGASMYYDKECSKPIVQFPEGGNIYCSGDIIFDTVNRGNVYTYDAGFRDMGVTDDKEDEGGYNPDWKDIIPPGKIQDWFGKLTEDLVNKKYDYYSLSYGGKIPVKTTINGDVFCQGRMIIAPDTKYSFVNYKGYEKLGISPDFSKTDNYINKTDFAKSDFVFRQHTTFLKQIQSKWKLLKGKNSDEAFDFGTVKLDVTYGRFDTGEELVTAPNTLKEKQNFSMESFIEAYKKAYNESGNTLSVQRLKNRFEYLKYQLNEEGNLVDDQGNEFVIDVNGNLVCDGKIYKIKSKSDLRIVEIGNEKNEKGNAIINYSFISGDNNVSFGGKYYDQKEKKWKEYVNIEDFRTPEFSETSNLYIQNSPIRKGMSCGDADHKNSNGIDPCTLEKYASKDDYRVVENVDKKDEDGKPVTSRTKVGDISYTAALSVRYCKITVNNVFCDGTISVLESKIPGFKNAAFVKVENNYLCSDSVKNELKKASIKDFLRSLNLSKDEILKEYFGVDKNNNDNNAFKGETNFVFDVRDDSQDEYEEEWKDGRKKYKEDITHDRKVVIIRAHYEMTETVTWENKEEWKLSRDYCEWGTTWDDKGKRFHKYLIKNHGEDWSRTLPTYSEGKYVADLVYCIEDNAQYSGNGYENKHNNYTNKLIKSDGEYVEYKDRASLNLTAEEEALVKYLYESKDSGIYKYALSLTQTAFIDFRTTPIDENGKTYNTFKDYFLEKNVAGFNTATDNPNNTKGAVLSNKVELPAEKCNILYHEEHDKYLKEKNSPEKVSYYKSASRTTTARYYFTLKPFNFITGVKDNKIGKLAGLDKLSYVLDGNDILESAFLNTEYLIAMFSNGANDFGGIINGLVKDSAIREGKEVTFGEGGSISDQFDAMKRVTSAFKKNSKYGMYLVIDKKYSLVDKYASVLAIFDEIKSSKFATVVEANMNQDESKENLEKKLQDLIDDNNIDEYNAFDVYGRDAGKPVKDYMAINPITGKNEQLRKKVISLTQDEETAKSSDSWMKVGLWKENQPIIASYWYLRTGSVEDDPALRLMRFYNKEKSGVVPLVADSTFGVDEKYERNRNNLSFSDGGFVAGRTEVYFTIKRNTYFNFADSKEKEIVFAADENGVLQNTRMNVLIDTSGGDVFIFFRCADDAKFVFKKCTFQVIGDNDAYLILMDNTSFDAAAFGAEINNSLGNKDKSDEKVGTHFKSGTYQRYDIKFKKHGLYVQATDLLDAVNVLARPVESRQNVGNMFIIGMGENCVSFGRGGSVSALVYIPHGKYQNQSSGILGFVPIGSSSNNEASIIANDIYIGGSNRGKLVFTSYDVARIGTANSSSGHVFGGIINPDTVSHDTKWTFGRYYYG